MEGSGEKRYVEAETKLLGPDRIYFCAPALCPLSTLLLRNQSFAMMQQRLCNTVRDKEPTSFLPVTIKTTTH
jgi:hypothetical protein